ncbi:MAG: hypothetical protein FJ290_07280 [Planctomycetes bacterium]|nr:hypothetical protein [Planctomycetota bacterium]
MSLVRPDSLAATLDAVNEAIFFGRPLSKADRREAAAWIAARQGLPGSYHGMFAPTESDRRGGMRLFTGERVATRAATAHILGEEACRALILLGGTGILPVAHRLEACATQGAALARATEGMLARLRAAEERERHMGRPWLGQYCCGRCTAALWRHLAAGGLERAEHHLAAGVEALRLSRDGEGRWRRYPFHYTVLALSEMDISLAIDELRYAAPILQRLARRAPEGDAFATRRHTLAQGVLGKV